MQEIQNLVIIMLIVFTTGLSLMGVFFFILINKYRKNLEKRQREALNNIIVGQDNERVRIARDLHDEMGPELSNIIFTLDGVKTQEPEIREMIEVSKGELKAAVQRLRNISHDLMSLSLIRYGLSDAIKEMIERQAQNELKIDFQSNCSGLDFNDAVKSHLFKISQELLYNTHKHSQATEVHMRLNQDTVKKHLEFTYSDNGIGNQGQKTTMGIGLKNIYTRVDLMNGKVQINMDNGFACNISVELT